MHECGLILIQQQGPGTLCSIEPKKEVANWVEPFIEKCGKGRFDRVNIFLKGKIQKEKNAK